MHDHNKWHQTHQTTSIQCLDVAGLHLQATVTGISCLSMPAQLQVADGQVEVPSKHQSPSGFTRSSLTRQILDNLLVLPPSKAVLSRLQQHARYTEQPLHRQNKFHDLSTFQSPPAATETSCLLMIVTNELHPWTSYRFQDYYEHQSGPSTKVQLM